MCLVLEKMGGRPMMASGKFIPYNQEREEDWIRGRIGLVWC